MQDSFDRMPELTMAFMRAMTILMDVHVATVTWKISSELANFSYLGTDYDIIGAAAMIKCLLHS